jgi:hypothetical protein
MPSDAAQRSYEHALNLTTETKYRDVVMARLGSLYLSRECFTEAKEIFLRFGRTACTSTNISIHTLVFTTVGLAHTSPYLLHVLTVPRASAARPSPGSWLGVGIACYRLNELSEAEEALAESNIYDSTDADVRTAHVHACV